MWVDAGGVRHTVALPDGSRLMDEAFRISLERLVESAGDELLQWLDNRQDVILSTPSIPSDNESNFEGVPAPDGLLRGGFDDLLGLESLLGSLDRRWQLDALLAIEDFAS